MDFLHFDRGVKSFVDKNATFEFHHLFKDGIFVVIACDCKWVSSDNQHLQIGQALDCEWQIVLDVDFVETDVEFLKVQEHLRALFSRLLQKVNVEVFELVATQI